MEDVTLDETELAKFATRPEFDVRPDSELRDRERHSLNRFPDYIDWEPGHPLSDIMRDLAQPVCIHRKSWEYALAIYGLRQLGVVHEDADVLAVGAGTEPPLYYFANNVRRMVATDLYDNPDHEGTPQMMRDATQFAPFAYREDHLEVYRMSGDQLEFPDNSFDAVFSLSSIEHFGSRETQRRCVDEVARVLKPGGVACLITELILNGYNDEEYFTLEEMQQTLLSNPQLSLIGGEPDYSISQSLLENPIHINDVKYLNRSPHIVLQRGGMQWTSFSLFLQKSGESA